MNRGLFAENERDAWIFLNKIPDLGPIRFRRLLLLAKSARGILELPVSGLQAAEVSREVAEVWYRAFRDPKNARWLETELKHLSRGDCHLVTELDGDYPTPLRELFDRPPVLYYKGRRPAPERIRVGLVGTRHPSSYGRSVAERLATDLCVQGIVTVSGLAQGIDTVVHQASLDAEGTTLAVLGCGLGQTFPKENAFLQERIAETGMVISEFPYSAEPQAPHFPRRNRIISGLSHGVAVIEAARRSGASITARFAAEQGRDVFAVPGSIFQPTSAGCHRLIQQGAQLIESAEDILETLKTPADVTPVETGAQSNGLAPQTSGGDKIQLSPLESQIVDLVLETPLTADEITRMTTRRFEEVASTLLSLELKGMIRMLSGQRYGQN